MKNDLLNDHFGPENIKSYNEGFDELLTLLLVVVAVVVLSVISIFVLAHVVEFFGQTFKFVV